MGNTTQKLPSEEVFMQALQILNQSGHLFEDYLAKSVISRQVKLLQQQKPESLEILSSSELLDLFFDVPLPSSREQVVVMNEIVSRFEKVDDFTGVYELYKSSEMFSALWGRAHERIFLCGWLSKCETENHVREVWEKAVGSRCHLYSMFLILKRLAEIITKE